jgi:hypothetical protein
MTNTWMSSLRVKNGSTVAESFDVVLNTADLTYPTNISAKGLTAKSFCRRKKLY